jgi:hypothetical protein
MKSKKELKKYSVTDWPPVNTAVDTCVVYRYPEYNTNTQHIPEISATHTEGITALYWVACIFRFPSLPSVVYFFLHSLPILLTYSTFPFITQNLILINLQALEQKINIQTYDLQRKA